MGEPIGKLIRAARVGAGLRLRDAAGVVGCSVTFVNDIEHSRRYCPIGMAYTWAVLLDADPIAWAQTAVNERFGGELAELGLELVVRERAGKQDNLAEG